MESVPGASYACGGRIDRWSLWLMSILAESKQRRSTLFLENICKRWPFKILEGGYPKLTYVDGFSGPWKSKERQFACRRLLKDGMRLSAAGRPKAEALTKQAAFSFEIND